MLSLFPQILFLAPAGVALIRVVAGLVVLSVAYHFYNEREAVAREHFPFVGRIPVWLSTFGTIIYFALGALLVVGLWTQVAALLAGLVALKCAIYVPRYPKLIPLSRTASLLLIAICLCLVVSGAGAYAFDLPL